MQSYPSPDVPAFMTAEEAQRALNKMRADALSDREHPAFFSGHPQACDFNAYSQQLYRIIAEAEAEAKDAAAVQALEDARAETGDLTPAECLARAAKLGATPGYVTGTLPPDERAKLAKEIGALYLVGTRTPDPDAEQAEETGDER
jgi:hypothetical protein